MLDHFPLSSWQTCEGRPVESAHGGPRIHEEKGDLLAESTEWDKESLLEKYCSEERAETFGWGRAGGRVLILRNSDNLLDHHAENSGAGHSDSQISP